MTFEGLNANYSKTKVSFVDTKVAAVAGATINATNHWKTSCQQADISYFNIITRDGYSHSHCNCMDCNLVRNTPFVVRKHDFTLDPGSGNVEVMFTDWFLRMMEKGLKIRLCPDILYISNEQKLKTPSINVNKYRQAFFVILFCEFAFVWLYAKLFDNYR